MLGIFPKFFYAYISFKAGLIKSVYQPALRNQRLRELRRKQIIKIKRFFHALFYLLMKGPKCLRALGSWFKNSFPLSIN